MYNFVSGCIHSHPGMQAARRLQVGHPCKGPAIMINTHNSVFRVYLGAS